MDAETRAAIEWLERNKPPRASDRRDNADAGGIEQWKTACLLRRLLLLRDEAGR